MSRALLQLEGLSKAYGKGEHKKHVLDNFSQDFKAGNFTILSGRSGSGKTTLLSIIGLLDRPDAGQYMIDSQNPYQLGSRALTRFRLQTFSYIFQRSGLIDAMSVKQSLLLPLRYRPRFARKINKAKTIAEALKQAGLDIPLNRKVQTLSGGERIRLAVARALITPFAVLLCDEPSAALDAQNTERVGKLLSQLAREGKTVIVASHDPQLQSHADHIVDLEAL